MRNTFVLVTVVVLVQTCLNIYLISQDPLQSFTYLLVLLVNAIAIFLTSTMLDDPFNQKSKEYFDITEASISVFIKVLIFMLPLIMLVGLYIVSITHEQVRLTEANDWVSFILAIAAFVMSLITIWQSETTYTRIFNALDKLKEDTQDIKKNSDFKSMLKSEMVELNLKPNMNGDQQTNGGDGQ